MYIVQDRKTEQSFMERLSTKSAATKSLTRTSIKHFRDFCMSQYQKSEDQIFDTLLKLEPIQRESAIYDMLQTFTNFTDGRKVQPITVKIYFAMVRPYIAYRTGIKIHSEDVNENIKFRRLLKKKKYIPSVEQISSILEYIKPRKKALYLSLLSSGISLGEGCQVRKRDFTPGERYKLHVPAENRKVKSEKTTYISKEAEKYTIPLLDAIGPDDLVYTDNPNTRFAVVAEDEYFIRVRKKANILEKEDNGRNKITLHTFRSFFITKCEKINAGLGHALAGHGRYMAIYERYSEKELLDFYLRAEPELTVYKTNVMQQPQPQYVTPQNELEMLKQQIERQKIDMQNQKQQYENTIQKMLQERVLELIPTQLESTHLKALQL